MESAASQGDHYLKKELYSLVQGDGSVFDLLQASTLDGIWYGDLERPEEVWYSPRFKALLGYRDDEVPNRASWWQERMFAEDLPVVQANLRLHCEDPEHPYDQVVRFRHKNGSTVWVRRRGVAIRDAEGRPIRLLGGQTDLTGLPRPDASAEQRLRAAAAELARSNADLEQFAYAASHDLQEPLRMIAGFLQLLDKRLSDSLDAEGREYMNYTLEGAERMRGLIDDLLTYSRVQTSSKPRESISLQVAIEEALANLRFALEESGAEFSCGDLPTIEADPVQMTQLFQNLIGNAIKFRGHQPLRIEVALRDSAADVLEICVADNGIGIEPRFAERIFGLFQRLHVREEYAGTGIGLAICKRIVERHGGTIRCESSVGKGATFVISLPRKALSWS